MARQRIIEGLPIAGIIAFSGCSVNALAHWLLGWSLNPTPWYWVAAVLAETCTAWLVWSVVDTLRTLTRSKLSKQDRRFYKIVFLAFVTLAIPSISASVVANHVEFQGNPLLAALFPVLTIACAIGAALPDVVKRYKKGQEEDKAAKAAAKLAREAAKEERAAKAVEEAAKAVEEMPPVVPMLTNKAARLSWMADHEDNLPSVDVLMAAWNVSERTIRRYTETFQPGWPGDTFPYPPEFNDALKQRIRERDGYRCAICNGHGKHVHHINCDKMDCRDENLITLCLRCHGKINGNMEHWETQLAIVAKGRTERAVAEELPKGD